MAKLTPIVDAAHGRRFLGTKEKRPLGHNTRLRRRDSGVEVVYHSTAVVTLHDDGSLTLGTGGWYTPTTKERINAYLPPGWSLYQRRGEWFLAESTGPFPGLPGTWRDHEWRDGMRLVPAPDTRTGFKIEI